MLSTLAWGLAAFYLATVTTSLWASSSDPRRQHWVRWCLRVLSLAALVTLWIRHHDIAAGVGTALGIASATFMRAYGRRRTRDPLAAREATHPAPAQ